MKVDLKGSWGHQSSKVAASTACSIREDRVRECGQKRGEVGRLCSSTQVRALQHLCDRGRGQAAATMLSRAVSASRGLLSSLVAHTAARGLPCLASARGTGWPSPSDSSPAPSSGGRGIAAEAKPWAMPLSSVGGYGRAGWQGRWRDRRQMHQLLADSEPHEGEEVQELEMDAASTQRAVPEPLEDQVAKWGGLSKKTVAALHSMGIFNPTEIQRMVSHQPPATVPGAVHVSRLERFCTDETRKCVPAPAPGRPRDPLAGMLA